MRTARDPYDGAVVVAARAVPKADAPPQGDPPPVVGARRITARTRTAIVAAATGVVAFAILVVSSGIDALGIEPYFDEMWRLDLVRSARPFGDVLPGVTPIPPGWVGFFRVFEPLFGAAPDGYRVLELALCALGVAALVVLLREWCRPRHDATDGADVVGLATAVVTALSLTVFSVVVSLTYFNQYRFELTYSVVLTTCCVMLGRHRAAFPCLVVGVGAAPLFVIAPLALLPALLIAAAWWAATADPDRRVARLVALGAVTLVGGAGALAVYLGVYDGMGDGIGLRESWAPASASLSSADRLVPRTLELVRDGVLGEDLGAIGVWQALAIVVLAAAFVTGAVTITRRWAWYPLLLGVGWLSMLVGGVVTDGPVIPVRVTIGFYWIVFVTIALGFFHAIACALARLRTPTSARVAGLAVVLVAVLVGLWPSAVPADDTTFARGLLGDLDRVVASPTRENLVLTYHYMAHPYTHDRLVNRAPDGRDFVVLGQRDPDDERLFDDVDALVRRYLPDGGTLWCVVPHALGPDDTGRACDVPARVHERGQSGGKQAVVTRYTVPPTR